MILCGPPTRKLHCNVHCVSIVNLYVSHKYKHTKFKLGLPVPWFCFLWSLLISRSWKRRLYAMVLFLRLSVRQSPETRTTKTRFSQLRSKQFRDMVSSDDPELYAGPNFVTRPNPEKRNPTWPDPTRSANLRSSWTRLDPKTDGQHQCVKLLSRSLERAAA